MLDQHLEHLKMVGQLVQHANHVRSDLFQEPIQRVRFWYNQWAEFIRKRNANMK
jgi:hypothetical protein